jgi:hypothetical protein
MVLLKRLNPLKWSVVQPLVPGTDIQLPNKVVGRALFTLALRLVLRVWSHTKIPPTPNLWAILVFPQVPACRSRASDPGSG